jgi:hypothetical protein
LLLRRREVRTVEMLDGIEDKLRRLQSERDARVRALTAIRAEIAALLRQTGPGSHEQR